MVGCCETLVLWCSLEIDGYQQTPFWVEGGARIVLQLKGRIMAEEKGTQGLRDELLSGTRLEMGRMNMNGYPVYMSACLDARS